MTIKINSFASVPDRPALGLFLKDYYTNVLPKLAEAGGPTVTASDLMDGLWDDIDDYLPPKGALILAHDDDKLIGCGFLKGLSPTSGELKRLCVSPDYRGHGLGKSLITARIDAARALGITDLYADTVRGNRPMLSLYESLGFQYTDRYDGNANPADWSEWLVYLHLDISQT